MCMRRDEDQNRVSETIDSHPRLVIPQKNSMFGTRNKKFGTRSVPNTPRFRTRAVPNTRTQRHPAHARSSVCKIYPSSRFRAQISARSRAHSHTLTHSAIKASATRPERRRRPHVRLSPGAGARSRGPRLNRDRVPRLDRTLDRETRRSQYTHSTAQTHLYL